MDAFNESTEQWATYIERYEQFVAANDVADEKQVAVLLSVMGSSTCGLLQGLIAPEKPGAKSYDDVVSVSKEHFSPKPIVIAERFRFHKRSKHESEAVVKDDAILKKLSKYCEFVTHLQDPLRDRFVCWLNRKVHQMDVKDSSNDDATDTKLPLFTMTKKEELSHICLKPKHRSSCLFKFKNNVQCTTSS